MGRIVAKVTVKNALDESKVRIFDALVDTGATLLTLSKAWKQNLGRFLTTEKERVQLADQNMVDVEICGPVTIQLEGFRKINMSCRVGTETILINIYFDIKKIFEDE